MKCYPLSGIGLTGIIILLTAVACVPSKPVTMVTNERTLGTGYISLDKIPAVQYSFNDRIHHVYTDSVSGLMTIQFRGLRKNGKTIKNNGRIAVFDPKPGEIVWEKPVSYQRDEYHQFDGYLMRYSGRNSVLLDVHTGKRQRDVANIFYYYDSNHNVGMGYRLLQGINRQNMLEGIDFADGSLLWRRPVNRDFSWNDVIGINDTTLLVVAGGLHTIDPRNGSGWSYDTRTGKKDYTRTIAANVFGIAAGLMTGHYTVTTGYDAITDVVSNVLADDESILMASANDLVKLDMQGNTLWQQPLKGREAGMSFIWYYHDLVCIVNSGSAFMGNYRIATGTPFLAAYDAETGEEVFKTYIESEKRDFIRGFDIDGDTILMVFRDRIARYSVTDGELLHERETGALGNGDLMDFIGDQVFRQEIEGVYYSMAAFDSEHHYVYTNSGTILTFDYDFELVDDVSRDDLFILHMAGPGYYLIRNATESRSVLLDSNLQVLADLNTAADVFQNGSRLYFIEGNDLVELNLSDVR
jgi:hypothetical protein